MTAADRESCLAAGSARRIAAVLHEPQLGGATLSLLRVVPLLEARGWRFSFWVPGEGAAADEVRRLGYGVETAERLMRFSVKSLRVPPGPARRMAGVPGYLRGWRAWLRRQDADLVHANSILALPEVVSRSRGGPPLVLHAHEVLPEGPKGAAAARLARRADHVVSVSQAAARALRGRGIESTVVYSAVPDPGTPPPPPPGAPLVVGTLGTVSRRKGSDLFLATAQRIKQERNGIEFRMVGPPVVGGERPWAQDLLEAARRSGIRHIPRAEPFAELAKWHIFLLPSRMDPCPLALLEAMAMGRPVVGTAVGGIPEQIGEDAGLLVPSEDVEGLVEAVLRLADSPDLRASLGAAARRRAVELFSLERQADALDRAYRRTIGAAEPRPASLAR